MGIVEATKTCFRKYITTSGRASRSEYWWFVLAVFLMSIVAAVIDMILFGAAPEGSGGPLSLLVSLGTFIPSVTAAIRRLHDTGKPWYYLLVPILGLAVGVGIMMALGGGSIGAVLGVIAIAAGFLLQLWWLIKPSDPGTNAFGPNPFDGGDENVAEVFE